MKNILVIHQSSELYGSDKMVLTLLAALDKTCFLPVVILPLEGPLKAELEKLEIKVIVMPVLKLYRKMFTPKNLLLFFSQVKKSIALLDELNKDYNFDIIYSNTLAVLLGAIYSRKRKIKHIWHVHEIIVHPRPIAYIFPVLLKKYANVVICNSKATFSNLISRQPGLKDKSVIVYNGLQAATQKESATNRGLPHYESQDIVVTLVGRINRLKGHKWLLSTYNSYLKSTNIKLLFVGSSVAGQEYYLDEVKAVIDQYAIGDRVTIMSFTKNLEAVWSITNIAVVPSTEAESFGLVALEAMLAHLPVVAAKHGALTEIVVDNTTGLLVEPSNDKDFADALIKLANNEEMRKTFGNKGYDRAKAEFSLEKYVNGMTTVLKNS